MSILDFGCLSTRFSYEANDHVASVVYSVQRDPKLPFHQKRHCACATPDPEPQQLVKTIASSSKNLLWWASLPYYHEVR